MAEANDKFELYRQILERAWSDADFKARLLENPEQVLRQEFNIKIQAGERITILEQAEPLNLLHLPPSSKDFIC